MLQGLVLLIAFQFAGEAAARASGLPAPGPVVGLAALALACLAAPRLFGLAEATADQLLRHLSLLFVPAGVGVLQHLPLVSAQALPLVGVLVASTVVTLAVTAAVFALLAKPEAGPRAGERAS